MRLGSAGLRAQRRDGITADRLPKVEIEYAYMDAGRSSIDAMVAAGVKGIVTAGHGAGNISTLQTAARNDAIAKGVMFVNTTRTGSGPVWASGPGMIAGADLMPQKARILLQLALAFGKDEAQIKEWFDTIGLPDFDMSRRTRPASTTTSAGR